MTIRGASWVGLVVGAVLGMGGFRPGARADAALVNGVAAIVNGHVITAEQVEQFAEPALRAALRQYMGRSRPTWDGKELEIKKAALEELIDRKLVIDEFRVKGYNMPDSIIDDLVKSEVRDKWRDRVSLTKDLQDRNQTFEDFRREVREAFIVRQMRVKNVNSQIIISPKRIEAYYATNRTQFDIPEQAKIRMILLDKTKRPVDAARTTADGIVAKARSGGDFAELANSFSDDAARNKGGDRGWIENKEAALRKELRDVAFRLQAGQVSDPLEVENTVFVLKVDERKSAGSRSLNEVRNEIESTLKSQEFDRLATTWTKRLRSKAYVRYF